MLMHQTQRPDMVSGAAYDLLIDLQNIEPVGLFARNLTECLALQLEDRGLYDTDMTPVITSACIAEEGMKASFA